MLNTDAPSILHLSVHGIGSRGVLFNLPSECCSLVMASDKEDSEKCLLSYHEILQIQNLNRVDLVILAACDSVIGEIEKGSSMRGIAYAFLVARAKVVICLDKKK